ncbi:DUF4245 domain-containing protein [Kitasatospora sp. NPDC088391]|uniref:DUF4245 domain-containing protein n=1 Tax=Kitasatospora sp. NPDC088391 TaxID=3364074 RepID=UPI0038191339
MADSSKRNRQSVRDMVLSMAAVGVVVVVAYFSIPGADEKNGGVHPVPFQAELSSARRAAPYPLLGPQPLPAGWQATSVTYSPGDKGHALWHLGLSTASGQYAAVEQSNDRPADVVSANVPGGKPDGTVTVDGQEWQRVQGDRYRALTRPAGGTGTTVLTGTASYEELAELARSLK